MTALDLHNTLFTSESDKRPIMRMNRIISLTSVQEQSSPTTTLSFINSPTYLDIVSRQPLHPDGPQHWDLGLDLIGDRPTAAECKSLQNRVTKERLCRSQTICLVFETLIGIWSTYCMIRYFLAFKTTSISSVRTLALVFCITSTITVAGVIVALFMPLFPEHVFIHASSQLRTTFRGCYIVLIVLTAIANLVFVLLWRPIDRCSWDIDVSWSTSRTIHSTLPHCHAASLEAWAIAASLRMLATFFVTLLYLYFLRAYFVARRPLKYPRQMCCPPFMTSDDIADSPLSNPSTSKVHLTLTRSTAAFGRSSSTLALTDSSATLAPTISLSSQSHSHTSVLATKSHHPPFSSAYRPHPTCPNCTSLSLLADADHRAGKLRQNGPSTTPRTLRRKSRISSDHVLQEVDIPRSCDECRELHMVVPGPLRIDCGVSDNTLSGAEHRDECSTGDCGSSYSYGYGASEPAYPYLEVYNPTMERDHNPAPSCSIVQEPRLSVTVIPDTMEQSSSSTTRDDSVEDELIPMMGGFVRRMATIESLGSREAASSIGRSRFSDTPTSLQSSLRFASCTPSITSTLSKNNSLGTAYFSASSNTGIVVGLSTVNERGELEAKIKSRGDNRYQYSRS